VNSRHRVVRRWGGPLTIALFAVLLSTCAFAEEDCGKLPDLWLPPHGTVGLADGGVSVQETTGDVCQGGEITITVTVDNLSCGDAGPFEVRVSYDGTTNVIGTQTVTGLPGCEFTVLTFVWDTTDAPVGEHEVIVCVDTTGAVTELVESNNCATVDASVNIWPNAPYVDATKERMSQVTEPGATIVYEVILYNDGCADQEDNPGHEFTDELPAGLSPDGTGTATSGTIDVENGAIVWDGAIPAGGQVTLTYKVKIDPTVEEGTEICNQGVVHWDSDGDGSNDTDEPTDDPTTPEVNDPTCLTVVFEGDVPPLSGTIDAPTLSEWGMLLLCLLFAGSFWRMVRRRPSAA